MSRAFVDEDAGNAPEPRYELPEPASEHYDEAAARRFLRAAGA